MGLTPAMARPTMRTVMDGAAPHIAWMEAKKVGKHQPRTDRKRTLDVDHCWPPTVPMIKMTWANKKSALRPKTSDMRP